MRAISIIFRREVGVYFKSAMGYLIAAGALFIAGLLFYIMALQPKAGARLSGEVLEKFFFYDSGLVMASALLLALRLIARERESGSLVLLNTSPVRDREIIIGKFLSAYAFLAFTIALSFYMPLLIMVNGKISLGQVLVGYCGLMLLGGAALSIGVFATSIAPDQLIAGLVALVILVAMLLFYPLSQALEAPLRDIFENAGLHQKNFWQFQKGILKLQHVVYYLGVMYFFLLLATKTLEAKRWR